MKKNFVALLKIIFVIALIITCFMYVPISDKTSLYRSVSDDFLLTQQMISSREVKSPRKADFIIYNNKLYLKIQDTQSGILLVTHVSRIDWDSYKIKKLRKQNPELEKYWPNPNQLNGGVKWIN
jgi:hypothetical protein